jgi:hypothetical protein
VRRLPSSGRVRAVANQTSSGMWSALRDFAVDGLTRDLGPPLCRVGLALPLMARALLVLPALH